MWGLSVGSAPSTPGLANMHAARYHEELVTGVAAALLAQLGGSSCGCGCGGQRWRWRQGHSCGRDSRTRLLVAGGASQKQASIQHPTRTNSTRNKRKKRHALTKFFG